MADRMNRPCKHAGCPDLTRDKTGYCDAHRLNQDKRRGTARERGYTRDWERESKAYLAEHPLCVTCESEGLFKAAKVVDHRIPHRGNPVLFWDKSNWQSMCKRHHDMKTASGQ